MMAKLNASGYDSKSIRSNAMLHADFSRASYQCLS
jgi:hypothetical protein